MAPKISAFAPPADLIAEMDFFLDRMEQALASEADFDAASQSRAWKDGHTLSAICLMLAVHDEMHPLAAAAPAMLAASQRLAESGDNYQIAKQALDSLQAARAGGAHAAPQAKWAKVASLSALMKQVPLLHAPLKRGVEPRRLKSRARETAPQAAALAAIAQAAELDVEHVADPGDEGAWRACCVEMRDAAGEVNSAVRAGDQARVDGGMKRLAQSCETCHAKFRRP